MKTLVNNTLKADLLENAPVIIAYHDLEHNIIWANKAYQTATGLSLKEIEERKCYSVWDLAKPCQNCPVVTAIKTGEPAEAELTPENQDNWPETQGSWLSKATPLKDENGKIIGAIEVAVDITERKRFEASLLESEMTLKTAQSAGKIGSWWYDPVTQIPAWTEEMFHIFGLEPQQEAIPYEDHRKIIHPEDWDRFDAAVTRAVTEGVGYNLELRITHPNGNIGYINSRCIAQKNNAGVVTRLIGTTQDVSERKVVEESLRESEEFKNTMIESSPDCIKVLDLEGNLKYMSKGGQEKLEIKDLKVYLNNNWIDFWHGKDNTNARMAIDAAIKGATGRFQGYSPTETGKPRWWDVIIAPIESADGEVEQLLAVSRDITEQKQMEAHLLQAQKMEAIGNLAGGIAHDFNNILSSVIGFTELALDEASKGTLLEDCLQEVYVAGKRAKELVKQILAFARQSDEKMRPIQPRIIVKEVLNFIRSTIPTTIEIQEDIKSESLVLGNATQVHQVLMNLCTNAAYAMEDSGGTLNLSLKDVFVDKEKLSISLKPGNYIEIEVSDTGTGIAPEIIDSIFEPYFTTKAPGEGIGIGLAMVQGVVESYGGKIAVKSQVGKGTTFTIYLPITKKRSDQEAYVPEELPTGTERILFVDDEASIAKMGCQILEGLGYSVKTRTSSVEALELFKTKPNEFDLVITDMTMPKPTGDKLAVELMKIRPDIPVILCTGYSKKLSNESALDIGIKAFAYKPVVKAELAKTVRKVIDQAKG